jgi:hypothetical protein
MAKVTVSLDRPLDDGDDLAQVVDAEINDFQRVMLQHHPAMQPLANFERAMLKTYLMARLLDNKPS